MRRTTHVIGYQGTGNLGDAIQTIALCRLLGDRCARSVARSHLPEHAFDSADLLIVNGWLNVGREHPHPSVTPETLFAGIHSLSRRPQGGTDDMAGVVAWYRRSAHPVGCRDRYTYEELRGLGLRAELVHCATLTLPRYGGPRSGICVVDFPLGEDDARCLADRLGEPVRRLSHRLLGPAAHRGFAYEWSRGLELLETYRRAALVITGRLHALLPCLAFGTPVIFQGDAWDGPYESNPRFSIARELGLRPGIVVGDVDTTAISARYLDFLRRGRVTVDPIPELTDLPLPLAA